MATFLRYPVLALAALLFSLGTSGYPAQASGGNATAQTVGVYRAACGSVATSSAVGTARFSADDQGGIPGGAEIRIGITAGLTRTTYSVSVLTGDCQMLQNAGTLITDDSGRGDLDVHVSGTTIPAGASLQVSLSGAGDVLSSPAVPAP
jgi:hypothetical protein